jgi:hypothetical protein
MDVLDQFRGHDWSVATLSSVKFRDFLIISTTTMSLTPNKKEFLCHIAGGLSTLMNGSMISDEIYTSQDDDTELYIRDNILDGSSFSENRFCKAMETIDKGTLVELLTYFDSRDMSISHAYIESCLVVNDLPEELQGFAESIDYKEIQTFYDFLEL